jgi:hypothetical protein
VPRRKRILAQSPLGRQKRHPCLPLEETDEIESPQEAPYHRPLSRGNLPWYSHGSDALAPRTACNSIRGVKFLFLPTLTSTRRSSPSSWYTHHISLGFGHTLNTFSFTDSPSIGSFSSSGCRRTTGSPSVPTTTAG